MDIQPGQLDRKITLQSATITRGAAGGRVKTWSDVATVWAKIEMQSGEERQEGGDVIARQRMDVVTWYYPGFKNTWRILYHGIAYEILGAPREIGRRRWMAFVAQEIGENTSAG